MVNIRLHFKWRLLLISGFHWNTDLLLLQPWCGEKEGLGVCWRKTKVRGKRKEKQWRKHSTIYLWGVLFVFFPLGVVVSHLSDWLMSFEFIIYKLIYQSSTCVCPGNFVHVAVVINLLILYISHWLVERLRIGLDKYLFVNSATVWACGYILQRIKFMLNTLFCHSDTPRGRSVRAQSTTVKTEFMQPHSSSVFLSLKAVWRRKSLLNVVPLSRSRP